MNPLIQSDLSLLSPVLAVLAALIGGVISSFSACGLATVPLLVGSVGGYSQRSASRAMLYSGIFCLGVIVVSTTLGGVAAFGSVLFLASVPYWNQILAVVMAAVGIALLGFVDTDRLTCRLPRVRPGLGGAFILGATGGLLATPCATPMLIAILAFASSTGSTLTGVLLMLAYSVGHVALPFVAGVSLGMVSRLAESTGSRQIGLWGKRLYGLFALAAAVYLGFGL